MRSKARRSAMWGRSLLILGAFLIFAAGAAFAGHGKLARDLRGKKSSDQVNVIVQFNQAPTTKHHKAVLKRGGKLRRELKLLRSGVCIDTSIGACRSRSQPRRALRCR